MIVSISNIPFQISAPGFRFARNQFSKPPKRQMSVKLMLSPVNNSEKLGWKPMPASGL